MPTGVVTRELVSKIELGVGAALLAVTFVRSGWCSWSLPRHGVPSPHGLETEICNWGTELAGLTVGVIAGLTIASGLISYRLRLRAGRWYAAQVPAAVAWGWLAYGLVYTLLIYEG